MKLMILGGKGQLGRDCTKVLNETHDVMSVDLDELDITDVSKVEAVAGNFRAEVIINCAAFTINALCSCRELHYLTNLSTIRMRKIDVHNAA